MTQKQKAQLRRKWKRWFRKIWGQAHQLVLTQYVWKEIGKIVDNNSKINVPSLFYDCLTDNHIAKVGTTIRSLAEKKKKRAKKYNTVSFHILLEDIAEHCEVFSRHYFYNRLRVPLPIRRVMADKQFKQFATLRANYISSRKIKKDLRTLKQRTSRIEAFVDKQVAHFDLSKGRRKLPTFDEADDVIKFLEKLILKYNLLIGANQPSLMPTITYDWKTPLRHAWIEEGQNQ